MKQYSPTRKLILLLFILAIVIDGLIFGINNSEKLLNAQNTSVITVSSSSHSSSSGTISIRKNISFFSFDTEIKNAQTVTELIKKLEKNSITKRIIILTLIVSIIISRGSLIFSTIPSIFPFSDIILSRRRMLRYIHRKDGKK